MPDFTQDDIEIGYYTDNWGPYSFNFPIASSVSANDGAIPFGSTITAAVVSAYVGNVNRKSTLISETEIPDIIDTDHPASITNGDTVAIRFVYPGIDYKGEKATVIFELTLSTGAKRAFYFQYLRIR